MSHNAIHLIVYGEDFFSEESIKIEKFSNHKNLSHHEAFAYGTSLRYQLTLPIKLGVSEISFVFINDDTGKEIPVSCEWEKRIRDTEIYSLNLDTATLCSTKETSALIWVKIILHTAFGTLSCKNTLENTDCFRLLIYDKEFTTPDWIKGNIIYHIFVDRFFKSGKVSLKKDCYYNNDCDAIPKYPDYPGQPIDNNEYFGGTLFGIAEKLEYLQSLGVGCLYLSPIFESHTNHKYDTGDYEKIDDAFGGEIAFHRLIKEAKKRDIKIILDGVFSHTGDDSKYFNRTKKYSTLGAYNSQESPYYPWYIFKEYPDSYECWWGIDILPTINKNNESYRTYIYGKNGIIGKYIEEGIAGWRLDVADEFPDDFLAGIRSAAKEKNPNAIIFGEVWEDASDKIAYGVRKKYFRGHELDSVMNYPMRNAIITFLKKKDGDFLKRTASVLYSHYPKCVCDTLMNLLGSHDTERILTVLGGKDGNTLTNKEKSQTVCSTKEREIAIQLLKFGVVLNYTVYGVPCIYYGDEAGMEGYNDPFNRRYYPWKKEDKDLISFYQKIASIRKKEKVFQKGEFEVMEGKYGYFSFIRYEENERIFVAVNLTDQEIESPYGAPSAGIDLFTNTSYKKYRLKKNSFCILKGKNNL